MTSDSEVFRRRNCCGMTEHCLAWRRSHCPDKVDDIYAVRKSSTDQCNSSGQLFCGSMKKISLFQFQETPSLAISYFENRDFEWYSRSGEMSLFFGTVKNWFYECAYFSQYISDVLSNVIGVTSKKSADSALSNCQNNSAYTLITCVCSKAENWGRFYEPPDIKLHCTSWLHRNQNANMLNETKCLRPKAEAKFKEP